MFYSKFRIVLKIIILSPRLSRHSNTIAAQSPAQYERALDLVLEPNLTVQCVHLVSDSVSC